jgi:WD40 repeat protein
VLALGTFPLRDFADGVELFEARHGASPPSFPPPRVDGGAPQVAPLPAALTADTEPLIGRTAELEWLEVLWQRAVAGERVTALVYGSPDIGKSRLLAEFARRCFAGGARVTVSPPDTERGGSEPELAVLDDFDGPTMDRLDRGATGVLVLAAARQPIAGAANIRELRGLSVDEVGLLLAHKIETVRLDLSAAIHSETHGNPGQVHDVARRLRDRESEERVQRALERVGVATQEARTMRDTIAGRVLERERLAALAHEGVPLGTCPYKGLARYEAADAPFFYGRERLVATVVARLAVDRFVGIIGASGSGKSSLVRAGLLPALAARALPGSDAWPTCALTPGEHPLRSFAHAIAPLVGVPGPELARRLDREPDELGLVLDAALRGRDGARVVVVVDQFEEIVTLCRDQQERERFAGTLIDAVTDPDVPAVVVPVVRADYYGALAVHPELAGLFEQSQLLVGAMSDAELRRAITEPARRAGLVLEDGLVDSVCADAGTEPGALPLVSTAMAETWARRDGTTLTLAAYREAGGVHGALARLADDVYAGMDEEGQTLAERLFLRLAEPVEGTDDVRRRMPREEFSGGAAGEDVLDAFVGRRLLVADGGSVEVAHEALLREWPRLRAWLEEDRDGRRLHRQLTEAAAAWAAEGRDPGALYRGTRLGAAQDWATSHPDALNPAEREFLDASVDAQHSELQRARRTARRSRSLAAAMAAFLVIALIAGGLALVQRSHAKHQAQAARREAAAAEQARTVSDATRLVSQARVLPPDQLDLALLLAVQGRRLDNSARTDGALATVLSQQVPPGLERILNVGVVTTECTDASPDGRLVAVCGVDGIARLYDLTSGSVVRALPGHPGTALQDVQLSADGTRLTGSDLSGDVFVWGVASGRLLGPPIHTAPPGQTTSAFTRTVFGGNNRVVTATLTSGVVRVWDITDPTQPAEIGAPYAGSFMPPGYPAGFAPRTFLPPGSDLLAFDNAGRTDVWNIRTHTLTYALPGGPLGESPDGTTLATAAGSQVLFWDLATGRLRGQPLDGYTCQGLCSVQFSRDGQRAAIPSGASVAVVDLPSGTAVGKAVPGQPVRYLDDGRVAIGAGQSVELWRPGNTAPAPFATRLDGANAPGVAHWLSSTAVYGLPGSYVVDTTAFTIAGPTPEWDASTGKRVGDLLSPPQPGAVVPNDDSIVNPGGTFAALREGDMIELWDVSHHRRAALLDPLQRQPLATWDPDGRILATTGLGGTLAFWDVSDAAHPTLLHRATLPGFKATSEAWAYFSPDGRTLAVQAEFLAFSPVTFLVSVPEARVRQVLRATGFSYGAVFTADSKTVATLQDSTSTDAQVYLWDVASGRPRSTPLVLPYPEGGSVAFVNADRWLVTAQSSVLAGVSRVTSRVDLWDVATRQQVGEPITVTGDAGSVEVDRPGGSRMVSSTSAPTGNDMVWDFDPAHWASIACRIAGRNLTQSEWKQYLPGRPYQPTCPEWPTG